MFDTRWEIRRDVGEVGARFCVTCVHALQRTRAMRQREEEKEWKEKRG